MTWPTGLSPPACNQRPALAGLHSQAEPLRSRESSHQNRLLKYNRSYEPWQGQGCQLDTATWRQRHKRRRLLMPPQSTGQSPQGTSSSGRRASDMHAPGSYPARPVLQRAWMISYPFTLHQLIVLKALAVTDSLEEAAELLAKSKTNVRMVVSKLELDLGRQLEIPRPRPGDDGKLLLVRLRKRSPSELTAAGKLLSKYSDRLIALAADALVAMRDLQNIKTGQMFIGASQTTGVYILPRLIERFKRKHPEVTVQLQVENTRRCCLAVSRGLVDIAVVGGEIPNDLAHLLQVTPYMEDEVVLVVEPGHPLAGRGQIEVSDLPGLHFVSLQKSSTVQGIRAILEEHGVVWSNLQVVMEVNSVESMKNAVEVGLGVAFVSRSAVEKEVALGSLAVLTVAGVPLQRTLLCVTDPVRYSSKAVRAFIQEMFNVAIPNSGQTTAAGGFLPDKGVIGGVPTFQNGGDRYPALLGRGPQISDMSELRWGVTAEEPSKEEGWHSDESGSGRGAVKAVELSMAQLPQLEKMPFTLQHCVMFRMAARSGSIKEAALALGLSAAAVSKSIASLEQTFGGDGKLVQRGHGRIWMTEAGDLFLRYSESILGVATEAYKALYDYSCANTGVVSLGASQTTGTYLLPRLIAIFRHRNPQVVVQLQVDPSRRICDAVAGGELDVAIIGGDIPLELVDTLAAVPYAQDELVLIVPRDHPLAAAGVVPRDALYSLTFVFLNAGSSVQLAQEATLRRQGILWRRLKIDMEFNSVEAIKGAVQNGLGVAFVSVSAIEKELRLGLVARVRIQGVKLERTLWLVTNPHRTLSHAGQKFMQEVFAIGPEDGAGSNGGASDGLTSRGEGAGVVPLKLPRVLPLRSIQSMPWEGSTNNYGAADELKQKQ